MRALVIISVACLAGCAAGGALRNDPYYQPPPPQPLIFYPMPLIQEGGGVAPAATAYATWTGVSNQVQTVTYRMALNCQYQYAGRTFWRLFEGACPGSIPVQ